MPGDRAGVLGRHVVAPVAGRVWGRWRPDGTLAGYAVAVRPGPGRHDALRALWVPMAFVGLATIVVAWSVGGGISGTSVDVVGAAILVGAVLIAARDRTRWHRSADGRDAALMVARLAYLNRAVAHEDDSPLARARTGGAELLEVHLEHPGDELAAYAVLAVLDERCDAVAARRRDAGRPPRAQPPAEDGPDAHARPSAVLRPAVVPMVTWAAAASAIALSPLVAGALVSASLAAVSLVPAVTTAIERGPALPAA